MTDKEKIRAEVERLRKCHQLKYQQLDVDDKMCLVECAQKNLCNDLLYFIDSLPEEPVSEDLLGIAMELEETIGTSPHSRLTVVEHLVKATDWQKQQMMKDSESAEIGYWNQRGLSIRLDESLERLGFGEDTKVKVIIIKED